MTAEEKAKAYNEAIERARKIYEQGTITESLAWVFPELKESEDERIRKVIINKIYSEKTVTEDGAKEKLKMINWLEKQGQSYTKKELQDMGFAFNLNGDIITPKEQEKDLKAYVEYEKRKWLEKQGEQKPAEWSEEDERIKKELIEHCEQQAEIFNTLSTANDYAKVQSWIAWLDPKHDYRYCENNIDENNAPKEYGKSEDEETRKEIIEFIKSSFPVGKNNRWVTWLEKQGEPADMLKNYFKNTPKEQLEKDFEELKVYNNLGVDVTTDVKPKFKVGDWVTNGIDCTFQIASIEDGIYYDTDDCGTDIESTEKTYHLWTIADTKDGDVLVDVRKKPMLFKKVVGGIANLYGDINDYGHFYPNTSCSIHAIVSPATKEQRDLLFQKMEEEGYSWNAEKKVLIKGKLYKFK